MARTLENINKSAFDSSSIIDVTGISKEKMIEILAITVSKGKPLCCLSWKSRTGNSRKYIGVDEFMYFNAMDSDVVLNIYNTQRAVWLMFYVLASVLLVFGIIYGFSYFGMNIISDKLINILGFLVGIGGLVLSYTALKTMPHPPSVR
jgi:hypothetical protein